MTERAFDVHRRQALSRLRTIRVILAAADECEARGLMRLLRGEAQRAGQVFQAASKAPLEGAKMRSERDDPLQRLLRYRDSGMDMQFARREQSLQRREALLRDGWLLLAAALSCGLVALWAQAIAVPASLLGILGALGLGLIGYVVGRCGR